MAGPTHDDHLSKSELFSEDPSVFKRLCSDEIFALDIGNLARRILESWLISPSAADTGVWKKIFTIFSPLPRKGHAIVSFPRDNEDIVVLFGGAASGTGHLHAMDVHQCKQGDYDINWVRRSLILLQAIF